MPRNKVEEGRKLVSITFNTDHYLANLLATTKILKIPLSKARTLCKNKPGVQIIFDIPIEIKSTSSTDSILEELDEYEIIVKITNQQ